MIIIEAFTIGDKEKQTLRILLSILEGTEPISFVMQRYNRSLIPVFVVTLFFPLDNTHD